MIIYDAIDYTKFTNPKTLKTNVAQGLTAHVESFLNVVLPNAYYEIGFYDNPEIQDHFSRCILVVIEWSEDIEHTETINKLKTGMTLIDIIEHWSTHGIPCG